MSPEDKLQAFYAVHDPAKDTRAVQKLVKKYGVGARRVVAAFCCKLRKKYGEDPDSLEPQTRSVCSIDLGSTIIGPMDAWIYSANHGMT